VRRWSMRGGGRARPGALPPVAVTMRTDSERTVRTVAGGEGSCPAQRGWAPQRGAPGSDLRPDAHDAAEGVGTLESNVSSQVGDKPNL
jgi:hypothetical protein